MNGSKIINDPVYGFIQLPTGIIFDIIQHPVFQRLRRIRQLGFTNLVYHGAEHTRFAHAIGAFHLMTEALNMLSSKGVEITSEEREAARIAILLHDIGHGPFSHSLEEVILPYHHERLTLALMRYLDGVFEGKIGLAIEIFAGTYHKPFLHELVSSQLDMDRMDYLNRDRFFTGVSEGVIGYDRIIHMLNVEDGKLVVEEKGIYSVEKFLVARRLMYWQVYLHKTSLAAEFMLKLVLNRARELLMNGTLGGYIPSPLHKILKLNWVQHEEISEDILQLFIELDDYDIISAVKEWRHSPDPLLSYLCDCLYFRRLFKTKIGSLQEIEQAYNKIRKDMIEDGRWREDEVDTMLHKEKAENHAYKSSLQNILILYKDGTVRDISEASDNLDIRALSQTVVKHYVSYPRI
ncbi:MAG: HD domain-containing protein [Bacteroidetes bacterium]|nr:HD domain-containing protein [Bacteroidota bacterium]